jgi:hypothetical protein
MKFDTSGEMRMLEKSDGLYVAGNGMLIPVNSEEEAIAIIAQIKAGKRPR